MKDYEDDGAWIWVAFAPGCRLIIVFVIRPGKQYVADKLVELTSKCISGLRPLLLHSTSFATLYLFCYTLPLLLHSTSFATLYLFCYTLPLFTLPLLLHSTSFATLYLFCYTLPLLLHSTSFATLYLFCYTLTVHAFLKSIFI